MISDVAAHTIFLNSLVDPSTDTTAGGLAGGEGGVGDLKIKSQYTLVTEESVVAGNQIMTRYTMETLNAKRLGAQSELLQKGMIFCKFNSSHKITSLEIMFDVMAFMLQIKCALGVDNFNDVVVPTTVSSIHEGGLGMGGMQRKRFDCPMILTLAVKPYTIVQVNDRWENLTGFTGGEVVGKHSPAVLQGPGTLQDEQGNRSKELERFMHPVLYQRPSNGVLINYTKKGRRFQNYITIYPLSTDSNITHYLGLSTFVRWLDGDGADGEDGLEAKEEEDNSCDVSSMTDNNACCSPKKRSREHSEDNDRNQKRAKVQDKNSFSSLQSSTSSKEGSKNGICAGDAKVTANANIPKSDSSITSSLAATDASATSSNKVDISIGGSSNGAEIKNRAEGTTTSHSSSQSTSQAVAPPVTLAQQSLLQGRVQFLNA